LSIKLELDLSSLFNKAWGLLKRFNIGHLLLLVLALHFLILSTPSDGFVFDEAHYVPAALKTLQLQPANAEHTPLSKIVIALSIAVFGNYWLAWRLPIVIASIASLYVFYLIANRFLVKKYALFATAFLSFDVMYFVNGSIFILDMPAILFGLVGIELYFAKKYKWSAVTFAVSFLMKELGLLFLGAVLIYHILTHRAVKKYVNKIDIRKFGSFLLVLLLVGGGGLWLYDIAYKPTTSTLLIQNINQNIVVDANGTTLTTITSTTNSTIAHYITNPVEHMMFAWGYFSGLAPAINTSEANFRPPWSWILPIGDIFNSPHYFSVAVTSGDVTKTITDYVSQITPTIAYMLIPILAIALWNLAKKKDTQLSLFYIAWITATYLPWLLFGIFVQRMTFNYYFIYTIPALALGIPYFWSSLPLSEKTKKIALIIHLGLTVVFFAAFFPVVLMR
jgi:4-amino-4-deoxy-L-arabinose transferase-like glycosyltransferase